MGGSQTGPLHTIVPGFNSVLIHCFNKRVGHAHHPLLQSVAVRCNVVFAPSAARNEYRLKPALFHGAIPLQLETLIILRALSSSLLLTRRQSGSLYSIIKTNKSSSSSSSSPPTFLRHININGQVSPTQHPWPHLRCPRLFRVHAHLLLLLRPLPFPRRRRPWLGLRQGSGLQAAGLSTLLGSLSWAALRYAKVPKET